jgi:hypothetical protein
MRQVPQIAVREQEEDGKLDDQLLEEIENKWIGMEITRDVSKRIRKRYR